MVEAVGVFLTECMVRLILGFLLVGNFSNPKVAGDINTDLLQNLSRNSARREHIACQHHKRKPSKFGLEHLKIGNPDTTIDLDPSGGFYPAEKKAAWILHVELSTRISTQTLPAGLGVETSALDSIHALFGITRRVLIEGAPTGETLFPATTVAVVAVAVLNQVIRPFTTRWHSKQCRTRRSFDPESNSVFRSQFGRNATGTAESRAGVGAHRRDA